MQVKKCVHLQIEIPSYPDGISRGSVLRKHMKKYK